MPENAIVADESITFGRAFYPTTHDAPPHDWMNVGGGAIGGGMPLATGAAVAANGRRVINLEADGSAMYTVQALWTQAREKLDVTTVIFSNRKYAILLHELANVGANPGRTALDMLDLGNPDLGFRRVGEGHGGRGGAGRQHGEVQRPVRVLARAKRPVPDRGGDLTLPARGHW